jgi:AraC-like DNA-binding protein
MTVNLSHLLQFNLIIVFFLCGLFLLFVRGFKRPVVFSAIARLTTFTIILLNFILIHKTPHIGQSLFNPMMILNMLITIPLQFAYIFSLLRPESVGRRYWLSTGIPLAVLVLPYLVFIFLTGRLPFISSYSQLVGNIGEPQLWLCFAGVLLIVVETVALSVISFRMQKVHFRNIHSDFSYTEGVTLGWIRWLVFIFLIRGIFSTLSISLDWQIIRLFGLLFFPLEAIITTIWILRQKDLYRQPSKDNLTEQLEYTAGYLSEKNRKKLKEALLSLLEKDEIFKSHNLDRETVCEMLGINRTYFSQIICQDFNTTFYQLINSYRLKKSVEMMKSPSHQHVPLKNICKICGFKNASVFSTLFKQEYGVTPTEWREKTGI